MRWARLTPFLQARMQCSIFETNPSATSLRDFFMYSSASETDIWLMRPLPRSKPEWGVR